jgi:hypothetical protein
MDGKNWDRKDELVGLNITNKWDSLLVTLCHKMLKELSQCFIMGMDLRMDLDTQ